MLKKLAKYGNSTTLVIDKAILELLNMNEASIVKLTTDGKSLIITPVEAEKTIEKVSYEGFEAMVAAREESFKKMPKETFDSQTRQTMQKEFTDLFTKHRTPFSKFTTEILLSEKFQEELVKLTEKYDPVSNHAEYLKEYNKLTIEYCPELAEFYHEMEVIQKKYTPV